MENCQELIPTHTHARAPALFECSRWMLLNDALVLLKVNPHSDQTLKAARAQYLVMALWSHPDKTTGDPNVFLQVQEAWDVVNAALGGATAKADMTATINVLVALVSNPIGTVAPYTIETALRKCVCKGCDLPINAGTLRFGSLDPVAGAYGRYHHVSKQCLKIPSRLHLRLTALDVALGCTATDTTEEVRAMLLGSNDVVRGINELAPEHMEAFLEVAKDRDTWSKTTKALATKVAAEAAEAEAGTAPGAKPLLATKADTALGACKPGSLAGKVVVLSGVFDLPNAGKGFSKGKDQLQAIVKQAGGRCTTSLSRTTTHLLIGRLPGDSKISQATALGVKVIALPEFLKLVQGATDASIASVETDGIARSKGYGNKALKEGPSQAKMARLC